MDPRITPTTSLGPALLAALQAAPGDAQVQLLLSLVGQNLDLLLLDAGEGTPTLQMPSGQVIVAEGDLPYPAGTRLTVQVQQPTPDQAAPRLKLLQALPPPPAPILAPLVQGEGPQLLARLRAPDPPPELQPLVRLLASLAPQAAPAAPPQAAPAAPPQSAPAPASPPPAASAISGTLSPERILAWLRELPPAAVSTLQRALLPQAATPRPLPELADAVQRFLATAPSAEPTSSPAPRPTSVPAPAPSPAAPAPVATPAPAGPTAVTPEVVAGEALPRSPGGTPATPAPPPRGNSTSTPVPSGPSVPVPAAPSLAAPAPVLPAPSPSMPAFDPAPFQDLLRLLLAAAGPGVEDAAPAFARGSGQPGPLSGPPRPAAEPHAPALAPAPPAASERAASTPAESKPARATEPAPRSSAESTPATDHPAESPRVWSQWLREGVKALADPQVSPREAPFHLAQAREGTAFFELPLPWEAPDQVLQMWVEQDGGQEGRPGAERTARVTVGLHFSALGETRIGVVRAGQGDRLQVRVWAEHPGPLRERETEIRADLADLGPGLDFQVLPLAATGEPVPDLRALALGPGFLALG